MRNVGNTESFFPGLWVELPLRWLYPRLYCLPYYCDEYTCRTMSRVHRTFSWNAYLTRFSSTCGCVSKDLVLALA